MREVKEMCLKSVSLCDQRTKRVRRSRPLTPPEMECQSGEHTFIHTSMGNGIGSGFDWPLISPF